MLNRTILLAALALFMAIPTFAADTCESGTFVGTYTRVDPATDVFGDGSTIHQYVYQLSLHSDGTAMQYWTGLPDYMINFGSGSPNIGSWKCKDNGKILVTLIGATYQSTLPDANVPSADISLSAHIRYMYLFEITSNKILTRTKARTRTYAAAQDPTDAAGGTLGNLSTTQVVYKRLEISGADLNTP